MNPTVLTFCNQIKSNTKILTSLPLNAKTKMLPENAIITDLI